MKPKNKLNRQFAPKSTERVGGRRRRRKKKMTIMSQLPSTPRAFKSTTITTMSFSIVFLCLLISQLGFLKSVASTLADFDGKFSNKFPQTKRKRKMESLQIVFSLKNNLELIKFVICNFLAGRDFSFGAA